MKATGTAGFSCIAISASVIALISAMPAYAQQVKSGESEGIGDIVVTAQKSSENLQKTAVAITAVSSEELVARGVTDLRAAQMVIPAARINNENNNTQVFVRGVGSNLDFPNVEPTVAFNFNGIFVPREATSTAFFDVASMEVLPGPQGTLYGRGAMGGAVNVNFKRPSFENGGTIQLEAGNYGLAHTTIAQDFALSDSFAIRVAGDYVKHDGYFTSGAHAADDFAGRVSMLYQPQNGFSAYVWASYAEKNGRAPNAVNHGASSPYFLTNDPWNDVGASTITNDTYNFLTGIGVVLPFTVGKVKAEDPGYDVFTMGGEFSFDFGDNATLTYLPGYVNLTSEPDYWLGSFLFDLPAKYEVQSHELRLSAKTGSVDWLGGLFYYDQENSGSTRNYYSGKGGPIVQQGFQIDRSTLEGFGIFGQAKVSLSEAFRVTIGGRYSDDKREANGFSPEYLFFGAAPSQPFSFKQSYSNFDWKVGAEYDLTPDVMIYAGAQTGYAPGTYNPITQAGINAGDPFVNVGTKYDGETEVGKADLLAFSAGIKSRFADDKVQLNVEAFHYTYEDLLQQQFNVALLYNPLFTAKEVEIYGFQADFVVKPTDNDRFNGSVAYTRARNQDFVTPGGADYSGLQSAYAPEWTVLGSYTHSFQLSNAKVDATVAGRYESSWWADFVHNPGTQQPSNAKLDASLTYISDKGWRVGAWGKNLTDEAVLGAAAAAGFPGPATGFLDTPLTYGVRFQADY